MLRAVVERWGGIESLTDPDAPVFDGGLALLDERAGVLVEPTCCSDLGDSSGWASAVDSRGADWQMLWIGHPWLSIRFASGRLVLSEPHEGSPPVPRWTVDPERLRTAAAAARAELRGSPACSCPSCPRSA